MTQNPTNPAAFFHPISAVEAYEASNGVVLIKNKHGKFVPMIMASVVASALDRNRIPHDIHEGNALAMAELAEHLSSTLSSAKV